MIDPTKEQVDAAAKAMHDASLRFFSEGSWRHLAREALVAAAGAAPQKPKDLSIVNGWLVESVGKHTCGAGMDGHGHEPGCGYMPVLNLAEIDGYPKQDGGSCGAREQPACLRVARKLDARRRPEIVVQALRHCVPMRDDAGA